VQGEWPRPRPLSPPDARVAVIGGLAATAWIAAPWLGRCRAWTRSATWHLDAGAACCCSSCLRRGGGGALLHAEDFRRVPWDTLFLFGGGLALAALIQDSGLSGNIGELLKGVAGWPPLAITALVVLVVILCDRVHQQRCDRRDLHAHPRALATTSGQPVVDLVVPAAVAASCAFMLPVGTAPNAIVYGSGRVLIRDMIRAGWLVNILGWAVIIAVAALTLRGSASRGARSAAHHGPRKGVPARSKLVRRPRPAPDSRAAWRRHGFCI